MIWDASLVFAMALCVSSGVACSSVESARGVRQTHASNSCQFLACGGTDGRDLRPRAVPLAVKDARNGAGGGIMGEVQGREYALGSGREEAGLPERPRGEL